MLIIPISIVFALIVIVIGLRFVDVEEITEETTEEITQDTETNEVDEDDQLLVIEVYDAEKAYNGTTLLYDGYGSGNRRIIEVDMEGNVVWEYTIDPNIDATGVGVDTELTEDDTILFVLSEYGVIEVNREGEIVWEYLDPDVSHDADRLENGNTLVVFGNRDGVTDAQVKEVNPDGEIVWEWYARSAYGDSEYTGILSGGWTHTNGADRLEDGNTMINLRNFDLTIIVDPEGNVVEEYDWNTYGEDVDPHEAEINDDTLLVCLQEDSDYAAVEINMETGEMVWGYSADGIRRSRDCDRLPNGNTLIVTVLMGKDNKSTIIEVTPDGEVVWQMILDTPLAEENAPGGGPGYFYKAQRL